MRFVKLIVTVVILALIAAFFWQNFQTFNTEQTFQLSLYFGQPIKWSHSLFALMGLSGAIGLVVGILFMLKPLMNVRKKLAGERQEKPETAPPKE